MIPLRDTVPSRNYPVINNTIIGINIILFLVELAQGSGLGRFIYVYGLVPARYSIPELSSYFSIGQQLLSLLSFMFLHGGFWHLLGNMWSLYIFGDNVEDHLGHFRYLIFYILCGIASGLTHLISDFYSTMPTIGASGAVAGVMGAYFILHPNAKILTLIPIIIIPYFIEISAFIFLGLWFVMQFFYAVISQEGASGIAWWAHIGGFIVGIILLKIFQLIPSVGLQDRLSTATEKKTTSRLQVIKPVGASNDAHLYGTISVSPREAFAGSRKLVNIPWGFHKRLFRINIPSGIEEGKILRLKGIGKQMPDGQRGDLLLRVEIQP